MVHNTLFIGAISAAIAVAIGAFGAHGLDGYLSQNFSLDSSQINKQLNNWKTGAHYHLIHAVALVLCFVLQQNKNIMLPRIKWSKRCFILGTLLFSGSLYVLVITQIKVLGAIVPLGGVCFILGWLLLAISHYRTTNI